MAWMMITCRCGHADDIDSFCATPVFGQLSPNQYQCPACGMAWSRRARGYQVIGSGAGSIVVPEKMVCESIEARL